MPAATPPAPALSPDESGVRMTLTRLTGDGLTGVLAETLADLELARRWRALDRAQTGAGPREVRSSLAGWQGQGSGADEDASERQVDHLWQLVAAPSSRVGRRAREGFVEALVEYCAETSRPDAEIDWSRARALALRLDALSDTPWGRALRALGARCTPRTLWEECAGVVADALAPPALQHAWAHPPTLGGAPGRPRVDRLAVPPDTDRVAWGSTQLVAALEAWARVKSLAA